MAVESVPTLTTIDFSVTGTVGQSYTVEFFASSSVGSPAAEYLGSTTVELTSESGTQSFTTILTTITSSNSLENLRVPSGWLVSVPAGSPIDGGLGNTQYVTATVTGPGNNTSPFAATAVPPAAPFVVTNTTDDQAGSDVGSLRQAIIDANTSPSQTQGGTDHITFNIPRAGPFTIGPTAVLPTIAVPTILDATSQSVVLDGGNQSFDGLILGPGSDGSTIEGLTIEHFADGIQVNSANNTIGGLSQVNADGGFTRSAAGNIISGNTSDGILIDDSGATKNIVEGNDIGTNPAGTAAMPNGVNGVEIKLGSATIGGTMTADGNVISGNTMDGILIESTGNLVAANFIGTDPAGTSSLPNQADGVEVQGPSNIIGWTVQGARNVISGNTMDGILIDHSGATNNLVQGNDIGTNASGTGPLANDENGIEISEGSATIGVTATSDPNVISGNLMDGILIQTSGNRVLSNFIGTNASGTGPLANDTGSDVSPNPGGVVILSATGNTIGGLNQVNPDGSVTRTAGNVISGNSASGINISNAGSPGHGNKVIGNYIGTDPNGGSAIRNSIGITISSASDNTIGGTAPGAGNLISGNLHDGINIVNSGTTGNQVVGNRIGTNAAGNAAIANGSDGVEIDNGATGNEIGGTVSLGTSGLAGNIISGNTAAGVEIDTAASGNVVVGNFIGTDPSGNSPVGNSIGIMISSASDNMIGGTSDADQNLISGNNSIGIQIVNSAMSNLVASNWIGLKVGGSGVVLPPILTSSYNIGVQIDDSPSNTIGGTLSNGGNVISGFGVGIEIDGVDGHSNVIQGNRIGTDSRGDIESGMIGIGVYLNGASENIVGEPGAGNEILGYSIYGVYIYGTQSTGNVIQSDTIGPPANNRRLVGIAIQDASSNTIGGSTAAEGNVISGNKYASVYIFGQNNSASHNRIAKNQFVDNGYGILLYNATNNGGSTQLLSQNRFKRDHIADIRVFVGSVTSSGTLAPSKGHRQKRRARALRPDERPQHERTGQHPAVRPARGDGSKAERAGPNHPHKSAFASMTGHRPALRALAEPMSAVPHGPMAHLASTRLIHPRSARAHADHAAGRSGS